MSLKQPTAARRVSLTLCAALIAALLLTFAGPSLAKPPGGGGGGNGNGGGGNGGGEDPPPPSNLPEFTIEFVGDSSTRIHGMNDYGDLVGETNTGLPYPDDWHAFLDVDGVGMLDLHAFASPDPNVVLRSAQAINNTGQVAIAGYRDNDGDGVVDQWVKYRLTLDDGTGSPLLEGLEQFPILEGFYGTRDLAGINDDGDVFGGEEVVPSDRHSVIWSTDSDADGLLDVVDLGNGGTWNAGGIRNRQAGGVIQVTGTRSASGINKWRWTGDLQGNGILEDLGSTPGSNGNGVSLGINDFGDCVGVDDFDIAFRYTDDGGMEDLGRLVTNPRKNELSGALAWGINNFRETVGWAWKGKVAGTNYNTLFLHHDDFGMVDVAPLITNWSNGLECGGGGSFESYHLFINDAGQIAGNAAEGAFILTPVAP